MLFFEVRVKYDKMMENGVVKRVTEAYAVDAMSFTEAEERITDQMQPYMQGDFEVTAEKIAPYTSLVEAKEGHEKYFLCKYTYTVINEATGKESKKHLETILIDALDFDSAKTVANEYMAESMADWQIDTLKETKIVDVFTQATANA